jgi:phosphohistidine swiveling domain-containing protein
MQWVFPLSQVDPDDTRRFGGKATALARLEAHRLPVPRGFVLGVEAFETYLETSGLAPLARAVRKGEGSASELRDRIRQGPLPPGVAGELREASLRLGLRFAVRSSAVDEDGHRQSFAGQYESFLDVAPGDALEEAVLACWASWYGDRAMAYRSGGLRRPPVAGMAVLVQELVDARTSGVMFTINPLTGSWREMVVEAVLGQGEDLVSGRSGADRGLLRRPRRTPRPVRRLLARLRVEETSYAVHGSQRCLSEDELVRLARLGLRVEALAGAPQDLEWTLSRTGEMVLLQSRAITAAGPPRRPKEVLWTRRFAGERWTEPVTPMGWSLVSDVLDWFISYPGTSQRYLGGAPTMRLVRGRPYFNATIFRHLVFKAPGAPPPRFLLEFFPPEEARGWLRRHAAPPDFRVWGSVLWETLQERRWRRFRWNPVTNPAAWDALVERFNADLPGISDPAGDPFSQVERGRDLLHEYVKIHVVSLLYANVLYQVGEGLVPADLKEDLLVNPTASHTRAVNQGLAELAQGAPMDAFLDRFGHRSSSSSWDVFSPRWADEPHRVERLVKALGRDPAGPRPAGEQLHNVESALVSLKERSAGLSRWTTPALLKLLHRYLELREEQRFHFDRLLHAMRGATVRAGEQVIDGIGEGVCWLQWAELVAVSDGRMAPDVARETAGRRRKRWDRYRQAPLPPVFLTGDEAVETRSGGPVLEGLGISPGRVTGPVRILHSPEDGDRLCAGDILVAPATDPGWTSLFLVAGGVVLELGSMLSHGAVVAREYRLPAVVNVPDAVSRLKEGSIVTVDGTTGRVIVHVEDGAAVD